MSSGEKLPPGRRGSIARVLRFRRDPLGEIPRIAEEFGPVARFTIGKQHIVVLSEPELIKQVLVTDGWDFVKTRALERTKRLLGLGLLTSEGEFHRRQRRLIQPAFNHDHLQSYANTMVRCTDAARERWRDGATVKVHEEMMRLTLEIVVAALFGSNVGSAAQVGETITEILENFDVMAGPLKMLLETMPTPAVRRFNRGRDHLRELIQKLIAERREHPAEHDDLLTLLVGSHDEGAAAMSDALLRDEVMTLFLAGHETTANALTYTWWLLAQNPDAEARVHAEVDAVLGARAATVADVGKLVYTRQVLAEAMRLYPPAWIMGRTPVTDIDLGGYVVPAGTIVIMSQWVVHRDARFFAEPLEFDPSRWQPESVSQRPKFSYFPFGAGTRVCIGEQFAWMEGVLAIATLAQRWRVRFATETSRELKLHPGITLRPVGGVPMRVERRG